MEIIGLMVLKCVIGLVVLYLIAAFFISFNRELPYFAIVTSIAVIVTSIFAYKNESIRWIPFFLSLLAQIFYHGEGYMSPKVQENLYRLASVERRYTALFASNDTYELHFEPVKMGGFLMNTLIYGLIFAIYYGMAFTRPAYGWAYMLPIYVICMSIMDILYMHDFPMIEIVHKLIKILVCVFAVYVGFMVGSEPKPIKTEKLYKQCNEVAKIDYLKSYKIEYITKVTDGNDYTYALLDKSYFMYDSSLDVGAFYNIVDDNPIYTKVIYKDAYSSELVEYTSISDQETKFVFSKYASIVGGPFKYVTIDQPFDTYTTFTRDMFFNATNISKSSGGIKLSYSHDTSDGYYTIIYFFKTNQKGVPVSVSGVDCSIRIGEYLYEINYDLVDEETGLDILFNEYKTLNYGYVYNKTEEYQIDIVSTVGWLQHSEDNISIYDFNLKETYGGASSMYVYDADKEIVGLYTSNYLDSYDAMGNNDFNAYMPDYYIFNDYEIIENTSDWNVAAPEREFEKYTYDNKFATKVIKEGFLAFGDIMTENVTIDDDTTIVSLVCLHHDISDSNFITYKLYYKGTNGEYEIYKVELNTTYENREYTLTVHYDDVFSFA